MLPPLRRLEVDEGRLLVEATLGPLFEGPAGLVHGGFLTTAFDIVGSAVVRQQLPEALTRSLSVRFLRPTALGTVLLEGVLGEVGARLADVTVTARVDGRVTARARLQFAVPGRQA